MQNTVIATTGIALGASILSSCATSKGTMPAASESKKKRKIGSLEVSPIGLGCMSMAGVYNPPQPKEEMIKVIRTAVDNGVDF